ncbi:complex I NDUFA9 subunit family protein [Silvimonas iriomotensis]|uniref:NAD-dependent dehydratase n=1 Tax=Silvimonas iriomotensis TaxID=449662 RepID=A0ABQ2PDA6_9NEIS|nr:complex I NDUFA9 subunit family protein [Silvimonas iriomotensis]GGP23532.1 NAD-dependent dehydratase [Silvimonas iriomotensis]
MTWQGIRPPVLLIGGSGFIGRALAARLCREGYEVTVPVRDRERARSRLLTLPGVTVVQADLFDGATLDSLVPEQGVVINLVGILQGSQKQFEHAHVTLTQRILTACERHDVRRYLHMSALGADPHGLSMYQRSKGQAETLVAQSPLAWTIFRPSVVFGEEDRFLNLFAQLQQIAPMVPLACARARFQPVWVQDVVDAFAAALQRRDWIGQRFDLAGPKVYTLAELVHYAGRISAHSRAVVPLPGWAGRLQATLMSLLPNPPISRDNLDSMQIDNVSDQPFPPVRPGFVPTALESVAPGWLSPRARKGRYAAWRSGARHKR